ncbi:hypothetical protein [Pseudoruegeria sp. HB172150]|uniref:hypothetical protein n=1 Tax=Pseudoruegeria sp. HB172150 TaxID=2721164 RepID=UPI0020A6AA3C|nr:hypothetical protein [Pseudoruegeria sp. HB172150]
MTKDTPSTTAAPVADRLTGFVLAVVLLAVIGTEWTGLAVFEPVSGVFAIAALALMTPFVGRTGRIFVGVGVLLTVALALTSAAWGEDLVIALGKASFIAAFFTALTSLRHAADTSPAIARCGKFLAEQPPGRRYLALTGGAHIFALLLNYGAIALLGSLAMTSARTEPNEEIRGHRIRRMLLAIQRGFISSLPWSPLAFAMAVSLSVVPGSSWAKAVGPCLVSAAILIVTGWALDTIFKPRIRTATGPRRYEPEGSWALMLPLLLLLVLLAVLVGGLHVTTGIRSVGVVMVVVPLIAAGWVLIQSETGRGRALAGRGGGYFARDLPKYRSELVLLMMAGFIGTMGSHLLVPVIQASGLDLTVVPGWVILLVLIWGIPLAGQIGANPILAVSLVAPVLPSPAELGLTPTDIIVAITAGWAMSGVTSPYTATTLLVGNFGGVTARHVGLNWNLGYVALTGVLLSGWVLIWAAM